MRNENSYNNRWNLFFEGGRNNLEEKKMKVIKEQKIDNEKLQDTKQANEKLEKDNLKKEKTLGEKIVEGRKDKGLSQEKFAEKIGCTRQMVSRWEQNQATPRMQKIKKMSSVLGIPVQELIFTDKEKLKEQRKKKLKKLLNRKNIIRCLIIAVIIISALYFLYSGYKFLVLNTISSRVAEYENANNYHFIIETYIDNGRTNKKEAWYKDGLYKITETNIANNVEKSNTIYLDINNGYRYLIDEENKTYSQVKLFNSESYDNGKFMYSLFPLDIKRENINFKEVYLKINKFFAYFKDNKIYLTINNENIQFNKDTLLPISQTTVFTENQNIIEKLIKYRIELNLVNNKDVEISDEYKKMN